MIAQLAWKNIWRNQTRSSIFISAAVLGIAVALFAMSLVTTLSNQRIDDAVNTQTSHLQVHNAKFPESRRAEETIEKADVLVKKIRELPEVLDASRRLLYNGIASSSRNSRPVTITGTTIARERNVSTLENFLIDGAVLTDKKRNRILIGEKLAQKLSLKVGSKMVLTLQNSDKDVVGASFRIAGIFRTPNSEFDEMTVFTSSNDLAMLAGIALPHEIAVRLKNIRDVESVKSKIAEILPENTEVKTWEELMPEFLTFSQFLDMTNGIFLVIILIGLGFGLLNTMNMVVIERMRELGMLRIIGVKRFSLFGTLIVEGVLMSFIGAIGGVLLGFLFVFIAGTTGVTLFEGLESQGLRNTVYPAVEWAMLPSIVVLITVISLIVGFLPGIKTLKMDMAKAVRD